MTFLAICFVVLVAALVIGFTLSQLSDHALKGWEQANKVQERTINYQAARIVTLENRLISHDVSEFHSYQSAPDELTKTAFFEDVTAETANRFVEDVENDFFAERMRASGADLEEGPILG